MQKTTVVIDEKLIEAAMKVTRLGTKREVIEEGLRELVRKRGRELLRSELGSFNLDLTIDALENNRREG